MSVLLTVATLFEVAPMVERRAPGLAATGVGAPGTVLRLDDLDLLVTGVGGVQCAAHVARVLARDQYELVVQAGIAGSFSPQIPIRSVVRVVSEVCADLGAEDNGGFLHLSDMGFLEPDQFPFSNGVLPASEIELTALATVSNVRSVTVNRVLSEAHSISWIKQRFDPHVVNMEGAALFYAALVAGVPFLSLRAISDMVGPRDTSTWEIPGAIQALDAVLEGVLRELKGR